MSLTDVLTAVGAMLTGVGLIYTGIQVKLSRKTTRSQFLLQLYQLMEQHNEVHARLTGLGWPDGRQGPDTVQEWLQVGRLLGVFEYIQILVQDGLLDLDTVDELYSYRLFHVWKNEAIRQRHFADDRRWKGVVKLLNELQDRRIFRLLSKEYGAPSDVPTSSAIQPKS